MVQLLLVLDFLHTSNIVHRDIKLDNILINNISEGEYDVKIADLGLAIELPHDTTKLLNQYCGSPCYFAPEILRLTGYREKVDIFSLGSVLFNLFTGRYLFNGDTK